MSNIMVSGILFKNLLLMLDTVTVPFGIVITG